MAQIRENEEEEGDHVGAVREGQTCYGPQIAARDAYDPQITQITQKDGRGDKESVKSVKSVDDCGWNIWSRLEVSSVVGTGRHLLFKRPLSLNVTFDVDEKEFVLEFPDLNIFLSAYTPEELYKAFCDDIVWLWGEYGQCKDSDLSEDGIVLKREILALVDAENALHPQITQIDAD